MFMLLFNSPFEDESSDPAAEDNKLKRDMKAQESFLKDQDDKNSTGE